MNKKEIIVRLIVGIDTDGYCTLDEGTTLGEFFRRNRPSRAFKCFVNHDEVTNDDLSSILENGDRIEVDIDVINLIESKYYN